MEMHGLCLNLKLYADANQEIVALDSLNTKTTAVLEKSVASENNLKTTYQLDSTASIQLKEFKPNYLKYESNNRNEGIAVFSEIYYSQGWNAYIDGKLIPHFRVNYVLRAMEIPKGNHTIEFKFEPQVVETGSKVALASSVVLGYFTFNRFILWI